MIKNVMVKGYRLLHEFQADLGQLTVIIGPNASGKSTLLDFLSFVTQCAEHPINTVLGWHWGWFSLLNPSVTENKVEWKIGFRKPGKGNHWNTLPLEDDLDLMYEVVLTGDQQGQANLQYEVLRRCEPRAGYTEPFKFLEVTPYRSHIYDRAQHNLVPFDEAVPQTQLLKDSPQQDSGSGNEMHGLPIVAKEAALRLSQMRFYNEFPVPSFARFLLSNMMFYTGFEVGPTSGLRLRPAEIRPVTTLFSNGENLGTVLHEILTRFDYKSAADDLRGFLRSAYPWVEDVNAETTYGSPAKVLVRVREKGIKRSLELWELSDGMSRFLCLGVALLNPSPPPFIAVDEPEVGLHPRLLPIVGDMIKTASEKTQVLVTTHSPDLLNQFSIDDVAVMSREETHAAWRRPATRKSLVQMLNQVTGESLGDLLKSGELESVE
jgi:predicted ATPase